jgi:hypothetical protein
MILYILFLLAQHFDRSDAKLGPKAGSLILTKYLERLNPKILSLLADKTRKFFMVCNHFFPVT